MSTHDPDASHAPSLPPGALEDIEAFRSVRPSEALMARVRSSLAYAEKREALAASQTQRRAPPRGVGWAAAGVTVLAAAAAAIVGVRGAPTRADAPVHVSVRLGDEGPAWVQLPARLHEHGGVATTVHVDVHAHQAQDAEPALGEEHLPRTCMGALCSHRAVSTATSGSARAALRVRIHQPGRYEIRVTHASQAHMQHDHFVVLATR